MGGHSLVRYVRSTGLFQAAGRHVVRSLKLTVRTDQEDRTVLCAQLGRFQPASVTLTYISDESDCRHGFWLHAMSVKPAFRRMGVGTWLCRQALDMAARMGAETVLLTVGEDNIAALALYSKLGFVRLPSDGPLAPELHRLEAIAGKPYAAMQARVGPSG